MREIEFKAWSTVERKMLSWNELLDIDLRDTFVAPKATGLILMQYTGLKDKNGAKIYDGDIISIQGDLKNFISKIEWKQEISSFIIEDYGVLNIDILDFIQVIGNIYDNPELLEKENTDVK